MGESLRLRLLAFAQSASTSADVVESTSQLRAHLSALLAGVDKIALNINRVYEPAQLPGGHTVGIVRTIDASSGVEHVHTAVTARHDADHFAERFRRAGLPVAEYRDPIVLTYSNSGYIGTILLWNLRSSPPVPSETIAVMHELQSFMTYLLFSAVARFRTAHRAYSRAFSDIEILSNTYPITTRERQVLLCRFAGKSIVQTAAELNISTASVRRDLRSLGQRLSSTDSEMLTRAVPAVRRSRRKHVEETDPDTKTSDQSR